ncbi:alanine--glyoxylate aminotransferase family protein [Lysinibacillus fusiformis]|uniref:pyridoxal-phosphate-dependent aminotransferase family protein n=1 Tax=Lysinibacillus fusiformis TaxID=28031 RepID=UPI000501C03A|nr:alanine--glyoxylate aminotransferase family protein [Lysinibacillus fusiformis]KAB0442560.1 alanine--glyoxylate aminotransferase family protein [Lysinibacillus fusiformis]KGA84339.1 class V aminotransferase [Lysinibacillus fusiformis]MCE4043131.1 alanine--glyoxylate aminotransferase family protein [Lysinibacillus fusiformis]QDZ99797.1 alanine--glyoxylate aminotransferase family protein [Lysinibacillus fusiformis]WEA40780.1 alanine--glyoxylate aminotransferase family protein [Lysinibacillus 
MYENILRHPGPTPIPKRVQLAMNRDIFSHRSQEFVELYRETIEAVKPVFGTTQDILLLPSGGTAALEAAAVNTVAAGEEVVVITVGAFGDYFVSICEQYGFHVHKLEKVWGQACTPDELRAFLQPLQNIKAVFVTYNETSTGILNPVAELAQVIHDETDALVIVDGVSCIGGAPAEMDAWGIDILVTGSQKAMMLPPGLSLISVSERAWQVIEDNQTPAYYLNLLSYRSWAEKGMTPNTPAITLIDGLHEVCQLIEQEGGFSQTIARHELMKNMVRSAMKALHIELLTEDQYASPTITAIKAPKGIELGEFLTHLKQQYHLDFAGGLGHLQGKIFRFGHMGYCFPSDILQAVSLLEAALQDFAYDFQPGAGVLAAQEVYLAGQRKALQR